jgi:hypothetical protein
MPLLKEARRWRRVDGALRRLGFQKIEVEAEGFRSGRLNDLLKIEV